MQIICITQKEADDPLSFPLHFFEDMEQAYAEMKLLKETAWSNQHMQIKSSTPTHLKVELLHPFFKDITIVILEIESLSLVDALNRMRVTKPAITPTDYFRLNIDE